MITETRRRAYLDAMQVAVWLPRTELPFAAPSRLELLKPPVEAAPLQPDAAVPVASERAVEPTPARPEKPQLRVVVPEPKQPEAVAAPQAPEERPKAIEPPPRFALQLLRAGSVLLLVELPTGESFQSRDPGYILLKDLLRAARLPDSPQQVGDGEPIRWPLLHGGSLDQGAEAARDYVQGVLAAELETMGCDCIWLVGLPALRFAGEVGAEACCRELAIDGLGRALAIPGLETLMEQPATKAELWQAMRRSLPRWHRSS
ncbi:energy transducer TonB [Stutzerimonas degradans]|uniref:Energy transducer TonB n=1 Tax=Stutzerimonas degradans TaxID=2968968 RepID=A0A8E2QBW9_9GAMM|nr:energy transducer TonB [Stutzerimonas degradans]MCQ4277306.1 energy transducer TonB [Stutzerimonas degradans]PNF75969.1 energy transducer TonB [Stutzerimonas degradans]QPT21661.1 energy transducer TonB [Stutzerimonas degradans]